MNETAEVFPLQISAGLLGFAAEFASKEATRYYLSGVYVEPCPEGGVTATATDGHRLVSIYDPGGRIEAPLILRAANGFLAECRRYPTSPVIARSLGTRFIAERLPQKRRESPGCGIIETIDGMFPSWRGVVPKKVSETTVGAALRAEYLAAFAGLAKAGRHTGAVTLLSESKDGPSFVLPASSCAFEWVGVVMPMRGEAVPSALPSWLGIAPPAKARAA